MFSLLIFFFFAEIEDLEFDFFRDFDLLLLGKVIIVLTDFEFPFYCLTLIGCRTEVSGL